MEGSSSNKNYIGVGINITKSKNTEGKSCKKKGI